MANKKILIITSGGDAPGMNAALRAIVRTGIYHDCEIYGSELGFQGLIDHKIKPLHSSTVGNTIQRGGTILKSARCDAFLQAETQQSCRNYLKQHGFDSLIVLGGNGSFQGASALAKGNNLNVIGIPCTIDNDIVGTDYCIGFDTACNTALEAIDKIRDTALSHERNFIIEVMGRSSGFLAIKVGIAGGAEYILTPEFPLSTDQLIAKIQDKKCQKLTSIIVAAEANQPGRSIGIANDIREKSGIEYKTCILGHIQRGGTPSTMDRYTATLMGSKATTAILAGESHKMLAVVEGDIVLKPLPNPDHVTKLFTKEDLLELNNIVCGIGK